MKLLWFALGFALALFLCVFLNRREAARRSKRRRAAAGDGADEKKPAAKPQATKVIVFSILLTYHIAFAVGVWVVIVKDVYQLSTLLAFVGGVAVFAVAFYCWKSKAENLLKIKQGNPDLCGSLSDFSNMGSQ